MKPNLLLRISLIGCLNACSLPDPGLPAAPSAALLPTSTVGVILPITPTSHPPPSPDTSIVETAMPATPLDSPTPVVLEPTCQGQAWAVSALTGQIVSLGERSFGYKIVGWVSEDTFLVEGYGGFEISLDEIAVISIRESSRGSIAILTCDDEIYDPELDLFSASDPDHNLI